VEYYERDLALVHARGFGAVTGTKDKA